MGISKTTAEAAGPRGKSKKRKTVRLYGAESGKVSALVKLHDLGGRAIYFYDLLSGEMHHTEKPAQEMWDRWNRQGLEIDHPSGMNADKTADWVKYGRKEAKRRGLTVGE
jgi:hypothetical protein